MNCTEEKKGSGTYLCDGDKSWPKLTFTFMASEEDDKEVKFDLSYYHEKVKDSNKVRLLVRKAA